MVDEKRPLTKEERRQWQKRLEHVGGSPAHAATRRVGLTAMFPIRGEPR